MITSPVQASARIAVRLHAWGATDTDTEFAVQQASQGYGRQTWDFVEVVPETGGACLLDLLDPKSIAAEAGRSWAYVVYAAGRGL